MPLRHLLLTALCLLLGVHSLLALTSPKISASLADTDADGLTDIQEQALLERFAPTFMISAEDCSTAPATFTPDATVPHPLADDATIYGQAFPTTAHQVELHYYHLWRNDCGRFGHALDAEHISVLLRLDTKPLLPDRWQAVYWYAAAHEDTLCDASQITRASTLNALDHGSTIWISDGKHASFLNAELCHHGCGGDRCSQMKPLVVTRILNLGEIGHPMNGSAWTTSPQWPLTAKMTRTDFAITSIQRLEGLPETDIAWVNPEKRPVQGTIAAGGSTIGALGTSSRNTDTAITLSGAATGDALQRSYKNVKHSLGRSLRNTEKFLNHKPK